MLPQTFSAGVGNWVADEVLYQARLHPETTAKLLDEDEVRRLHDALYNVPKVAVEAGADSSKFPKDWLFHQVVDFVNCAQSAWEVALRGSCIH